MAEKFSLDVDNLKIVGEVYYPTQTKERQPALCICHGIPGSSPVLNDRGYPLLAERFANEGFITCIFNFRGCGESGGNLDLLGWTRDLTAVIDYLAQLKKVDRSRIALMGFSGGAAASVYVTAHDKRVFSLIACACPAEFMLTEERLEAMLQQCRDLRTIRDVGFPPSLKEWGSHFRAVNPIDWIEEVSPRPLLILHGEKDELINPVHAQMLYDKAKAPKELVMVPDGVHRLRTSEPAITAALGWLKKKCGSN
ncbi:MAG: alpha/beta fold hydrolase [Dehalococcoidia bacterium]|nr:alpha/beta fold hydrolase [Dehalococcoidia bacterium]